MDTRNRRSIALLEALGFSPRAVGLAAGVIYGSTADEAEYSLSLE